MPNRQVNPKDAALRFAFFSALNFTKPERKDHRLSSKPKSNSKTKCQNLYGNHLESESWDFFVALDKTLIYLEDSTAKSRTCYVMLGEQIHEVRVLKNGKSFKKGFMVVVIFTDNGTVPLVKVLSITNIN